MKRNHKVFFNFAKNRQKTISQVGPFLDPISGEINSDPNFSAECLSKQYSSVFTQPHPNWSIPNKQEFFQLDNVRQRETVLADFEFSETDIELACAELSYSSASGPDGIPSKLLKVCKKELKKPLFILWRSSLNQGIIPPDLLLVLISPIHKGGSRVDPSRYRPVALTSHLFKVFERVIRKTLVKHLEDLELIPATQHGFRQQISDMLL